MSERKERCETCRFWEPCSGLSFFNGDVPPNIEHGYCRRFPPVFGVEYQGEKGDDLSPSHDGGNWHLPVVVCVAWCGEWRGPDNDPTQDRLWREFFTSLYPTVQNALKEMNVNTWAAFSRVCVSDLRSYRQVGPSRAEQTFDAAARFRRERPEDFSRG